MSLPDIEFDQSLALVTGAGGGMGEHIAKGLARRGADLVLVDINEEGLTRVVSEIEAQTEAAVTPFVLDLADREAVGSWLDGLPESHPGINLLINNAGVALGGRFTEVEAADFDWLLEINLLAPIRITRALLPLLERNGNAQVVNLSSLFGLVGPAGQTAYSTAKFGLRGFSESLRNELEMDGVPVGVTCVHPGGIKTNIAKSARISGATDPQEVAKFQNAFDKMLKYPADKAAEQIIEAARKRQARLLIGTDAQGLDVLARVLPGAYGGVMKRAMELAARFS